MHDATASRIRGAGDSRAVPRLRYLSTAAGLVAEDEFAARLLIANATLTNGCVTITGSTMSTVTR
jgi:hypothetical protein